MKGYIFNRIKIILTIIFEYRPCTSRGDVQMHVIYWNVAHLCTHIQCSPITSNSLGGSPRGDWGITSKTFAVFPVFFFRGEDPSVMNRKWLHTLMIFSLSQSPPHPTSFNKHPSQSFTFDTKIAAHMHIDMAYLSNKTKKIAKEYFENIST